MIKESIQEEDIMFVNIHAPNIGAPKYINKILKYIKGEIDNNTIIVGMETDIPCKWKSKESWSSNTHIRQNRL